jgi:ribose transport system substrate-binding protein
VKQYPESSTDSRGSKSPYAVNAVARACDILASFRRSDETLRLQQIADRAGLHKVTAYRLLSTLIDKGLVERIGPHTYRPRFQPLNFRRYRIGYAAQSTVVPFISTVSESLKTAAQKRGLELIVLNNRASRKVALDNANLFIREKVDLVIEFQLHADIAVTLVERFTKAGIPMLAVDLPHPGAIYFGADNYKAGVIAGAHLGRWAASKWQGHVDEIVLLVESAGGPILNSRTLGILDGIQETLPHSNRVPVSRYESKAAFDSSLDVIRKHLRRSRGRQVLVGTVNDPSALGALQAFRDFGAEEICAIAGQGGVAEARHEMRRPGTRLVGSVAYFPETYGEKLIQLAMDVLEKRSVAALNLTRHQMLTPANVNKIYPNDLLMELRELAPIS